MFRFSKKSYFRVEYIEEHNRKGYEVIIYHESFQTTHVEWIPRILGIEYDYYLEESKKCNAVIMAHTNNHDETIFEYPFFNNKKDATKFKKKLEELMFFSKFSGKCLI